IQPVMFDLRAGVLSDSPAAVPGFIVPIISGLPITDWKDDVRPRFRDRTIELKRFETSRALAIRPDHSGFALGTEWSLHAFDAVGGQRWEKPAPGIAWSVNLAADGQLVLAAYGDGTFRWHRWSDGQELLALFVHKENRAWVAWTPSGYYTASA